MKKRLSSRFSHFDSSIFRRAMEMRDSLVDPIDLSVGEPEHDTHSRVKEAGMSAIKNDYTKYTPANGLLPLRADLQKKLIFENKTEYNVDQISVVPGLTTGLLLVYMAILDPGDHIVILEPAYPPYKQLAESLGVEVTAVDTAPTFVPKIENIENAINKKTKIIIINSPNNPTGAIYQESLLIDIANLARSKGIYLVSDEIYEHFVYEGVHFSPGRVYEDTISLFGFSKRHAMTGWRLGYITGPLDVIDAINELQQYAVFSSSSIAQHAAIEALRSYDDILEKFAEKRELVLDTLSRNQISYHGSEGAYYVFMECPESVSDAVFSEILLKENVVVIPGRAFSNTDRYIRISYGGDYDSVKKGMQAIDKVISVIK